MLEELSGLERWPFVAGAARGSAACACAAAYALKA